MKHILKKSINFTLSLIVAAGAALCISSCDQIKDNERYIELPAVESERVVLLEEFTGQLCVNCPDGHKIINSLQQQYPNNFIAVGIHAGDAFSIAEEYGGLRNAEGVQYAANNKVETFPCGVIDRVSGVQDMELWAANVRKRVETPAVLNIKVEAKLNPSKSAIDIQTLLSPSANINGRLQLWVIENGIVALQLYPSSRDMNYVHNHVFRGTVNGIDGETVKLLPREDQTLSHTVQIKEKWNPENLEIVAFVYNESGVEQAAIAEVE